MVVGISDTSSDSNPLYIHIISGQDDINCLAYCTPIICKPSLFGPVDWDLAINRVSLTKSEQDSQMLQIYYGNELGLEIDIQIISRIFRRPFERVQRSGKKVICVEISVGVCGSGG